MLKCDFHIHSKEDSYDSWILYSAKDLIDRAYDLGFDVISFTFHNIQFKDKAVSEYAKSKGILLLPGVEKTIEGKHILLYNFKDSELDKINKISDIRKYKSKTNLVVAPHPFFKLKICMGSELNKYKDVFDGLEISEFYSWILNLNKKAYVFSKMNNKTLLANSDLHYIERLGNNYTFVNSKKNINDLIISIKNNHVQLKTSPLKTRVFLGIIFKVVGNEIKRMFIK